MIISDCHIHSSISSDSDTKMSLMIQSAIDKGIKLLCFTEHMDYDFPEQYDLSFIFDPEDYFLEINSNRINWGDSIELLNGIELGLKNQYSKNYDELLESYNWDFVIGSVHLINDTDPYYPEYWNNKTTYECVQTYFETVYEDIRYYNNFDALGHLDYILRYNREGITFYDYSSHKSIIDDILKYIIKHDIALEINSSGFKSSLAAPNPGKALIERYSSLGGKLITIGSDAHSVEYIGYHFNKLNDILVHAGIREYAVYKKRTPVMYQL